MDFDRRHVELNGKAKQVVLILLASAAVAVLLVHVASYCPGDVFLVLFFGSGVISVLGGLANVKSKDLARKLATSEMASVKAIADHGKLFRLRFDRYNLGWAMIWWVAASFLYFQLFPARSGLVLVAACLTCSIWALLGAATRGKDRTLGLCWRAPFPVPRPSMPGCLEYAGAVMVLRQRRDHAIEDDWQHGGVNQLLLTAAHELTRTGRPAPTLRFWMPGLENRRAEHTARAGILAVIFVCSFLAAWLLVRPSDTAPLPPLWSRARQWAAVLVRSSESLEKPTSSERDASPAKNPNETRSGNPGSQSDRDQSSTSSKESGGGADGSPEGQQGAPGATVGGESGQSGRADDRGSGESSLESGQKGQPVAGGNQSRQSGDQTASSGSVSDASQRETGAGDGAPGTGSQGSRQKRNTAADGNQDGQSGGQASSPGGGSGASQSKTGPGGGPGEGPHRSGQKVNSAAGGNQGGQSGGQAESSGNGSGASQGSATVQGSGTSGQGESSGESSDPNPSHGTTGPGPQLASKPTSLPPLPSSPGAVINLDLPPHSPTAGPPPDQPSPGDQSSPKDRVAKPKYVPAPQSDARRPEAAPTEPVQHWPNWIFRLLKK